MTSTERIQSIINRQAVDRIPVDLWCTPEVLMSLGEHTGEAEELAIYNALNLDKLVSIFPAYKRRQDRGKSNEGTELNTWGVPMRQMVAGLATYREVVAAPFAACDTPSQLEAYDLWPALSQFDIAGAADRARRAKKFGFATLGPWVSFFEIYCQLRGLENALMDVADDSVLMEAALDRIEIIQTEMLKYMLVTLGDLLDIVFISDDMGTQGNLLISLGKWDRHFKPRIERWCDLIHAHGKKVLYHSDGAMSDLIPRLIDAGVDILNPIQHVCPGMDRRALKRRFGENMVFHGGVENQRIIPHGTPADVGAETLTCLETLGAGGGYICCSCHNVQAGTPVENILTMIECVQNFKL